MKVHVVFIKKKAQQFPGFFDTFIRVHLLLILNNCVEAVEDVTTGIQEMPRGEKGSDCDISN